MVFLFLTVLIGNNISFSLSDPIQAQITVDGNTSDWDNINPIASGSGNLTSLSAAQDDENLYLLIEGISMEQPYDFYLDTDNTGTTGLTSHSWSNGGADILIQGSLIYEYTGSGQNWSWAYIGNAVISENSSAKELSVTLAQIGKNEPGDIKIGCNRGSVDYAPLAGNDMAEATILITGTLPALDVTNINTISKKNVYISIMGQRRRSNRL